MKKKFGILIFMLLIVTVIPMTSGNRSDENQPPFASFTWAPSNPTIYKQVTFNASTSNDPDGSIIKYEWDWNNDGMYESSYTNPTTTATFMEGGNYPVILRVTDNDGSTSTKTITIPVTSGNGSNENKPPVANFTWTPSNPHPDQTITFDASTSNDPDGSIVKYEWNFDNDSKFEEFKTTPTAIHSWSQVGIYSVTLRITDNGGSTSTKRTTISVSSGSVNDDKGIPGFELILLLCAIILSILLLKKKRNT